MMVIMTGQRVAMIVTGLMVAVLSLVFFAVGWARASTLAGMVSALVGVVGAGIAVWAAFRPSPMPGAPPGRIRVHRTGSIRQTGSGSKTANTGVMNKSAGSGGTVEVSESGDIDQDDGGEANTGIRNA